MSSGCQEGIVRVPKWGLKAKLRLVNSGLAMFSQVKLGKGPLQTIEAYLRVHLGRRSPVE